MIAFGIACAGLGYLAAIATGIAAWFIGGRVALGGGFRVGPRMRSALRKTEGRRAEEIVRCTPDFRP